MTPPVPAPAEVGDAPRVVAVIDIGATSIRMQIAEIHPDGHCKTIDQFTQPVTIGKDVFAGAKIVRATIEACVRVLRSYRGILTEYKILPENIRVIATSAVREAENRLAFVDRIYIATGLQVEVLEEAEVTRVTYLGVQPLFKEKSTLARGLKVVIEIGGGSTEVLVLNGEEIVSSNTFRLGALRLRTQIETLHASTNAGKSVMESHVRRTVDQIKMILPPGKPFEMIALGGDMRYIADQLKPEWENESGIVKLSLNAVDRIARKLMELTEEEIVKETGLTYEEADTIGPALYAYTEIARSFHLKQVFVARANLRDGLVAELADRRVWTDEYRRQVIRTALELGRKFEFHEKHAVHVAELADLLFERMQSEHQLDPGYRLILYLAALLHEIGHYVNYRSHHKHSMYLIMNSDLFGLSRRDLLLVALVARYHRRSAPRPTHEGYVTLDRERRVAVCKLAALLRLADALDRSWSQRIKEIDVQIDPDRVNVLAAGVTDLSLEQFVVKQCSGFFDEVFGKELRLLRLMRRMPHETREPIHQS